MILSSNVIRSAAATVAVGVVKAAIRFVGGTCAFIVLSFLLLMLYAVNLIIAAVLVVLVGLVWRLAYKGGWWSVGFGLPGVIVLAYIADWLASR